jgi:phosphatidylglycerophosphate synthase
VWSEVQAIYRSSKKKVDINWFTEWICRPPASVIVYALRTTRVTPNQLTLLSLVIAAGAGAMFVFLPGHAWGFAAAMVIELSFLFDCADGMLARHRKIASPVGHLLDFMIDEVKAMLIFGCVTVRVWREHPGDDWYLIVGLAALFCLASGLTLTAFMRRPEYGGAKPITEDGQPAEVKKRRGPVGLAIGTLEHGARFLVHYPQYIWLCAALDRLDVFFWIYGGVNALYFARCLLAVTLKLGRFAPREVSP